MGPPMLLGPPTMPPRGQEPSALLASLKWELPGELWATLSEKSFSTGTSSPHWEGTCPSARKNKPRGKSLGLKTTCLRLGLGLAAAAAALCAPAGACCPPREGLPTAPRCTEPSRPPAPTAGQHSRYQLREPPPPPVPTGPTRRLLKMAPPWRQRRRGRAGGGKAEVKPRFKGR